MSDDGANAGGQIAGPASIHRVQAAPLFAGLDWHLAVSAVLAGEAAGEVYADLAPDPRCGLLLTGHRVYLAGDPGSGEFLATLRPVLEQRLIADGCDRGAFTLYYDHPDWPMAAAAVPSAGWNAYRPAPCCHFVKDWRSESQPSAAPAPPAGFRVVAVDGTVLDDPTLENKQALVEEMCSERPSVADFLARSFGLTLLQGNAVAGWCLSEYNLGRRCEIGIAVEGPLRRRGLATLLGGAFQRQALAAGVSEAGWHCWRDNAASCATARALGFALVHEYPACRVILSRATAPA